MVKAGKMTRRGLGIQAVSAPNAAAMAYGFNQVSKKFWIGQFETKRFDGATADRINLRAATWGFSRIDYCELWPQKFGTAKKSATAMCWASTRNCSVYAGASLDATTGVPIYGFVYGS